MPVNLTKTLIAIVAGLILFLGIFGVYNYFFGNSNTPIAQTPADTSAFPESSTVSTSNNEPTPVFNNGQQGNQTPIATSSSSPVSQSGAADIKIISDKPAAGGIFLGRPLVNSRVGTSTVTILNVRYMEGESGHIFDMTYNESLPRAVSNTTVTRIHQSLFNSTGDVVLMRRFSEDGNIQNIRGVILRGATTTISSTSTQDFIGKMSQSLLPATIKEVAISPSRNRIFYLTDVGGDFIGTTEDFSIKAGVNKKQVFDSPISEWQVQWPQDNILFFNTKPSADIPGFLYSQTLNKTGAVLTKVLGDINGLTSNISADAKKMIYAESIPGGMKTFIYDFTTGVSSGGSLATLPEKCVWSSADKNVVYCAVPGKLPAGSYPDDWYQGVISFNDELWRIDTKTGNGELILDRTTFDKSGGVDAIELTLSPNEDYLIFTNKKDSSLWQIKLR